MITVGSVRGKERFETPFLVAHERRSSDRAGVAAPTEVVRDAMSLGGQVRFMPALIENVGCPHWAQNGFRAFQSKMARAWA